MVSEVSEYVFTKQRKYKKWVIGVTICIGLFVIGLAASSGAYYHWRYVNTAECDLFCLDSLAVSLAFILTNVMCLVILIPVDAYCINKLHKLNHVINKAAVAQAVVISKGVVAV
ncbi:hypothetical protein PRJ_Fausto_00475 [Faustovirus]|nr:hypothetical protein PRJ_Fausto_00475 [Faustovirus]QBR98931.1 hypothetical protein [Faustovirus mariensis]